MVILALLLIPLIWGYNWVVMKQALRFCGPFEFAAWRYLLGSIVLFGAMALGKRSFRIRPAGAVVVVGLLQIAANTGLTMWALLLGSAGRTAILTYTTPLWVVLFGWPLLRERPTREKWLALITSGVGVGLIFLSTIGRSRLDAVILATLSGCSQAGGTILARKLLDRYQVDVLALTAWQILVGGLALSVAAFLVPGRPTHWTPYLGFAMFYEAVPATAFAFWLWYSLLQRVEAGIATLASLATPAIGILLTALWLHERPRGTEALGMALIFASLVIVGPIALRQARNGRAQATTASSPGGDGKELHAV